MSENTTTTVRTLTDAEAASYAGKPTHRAAVDVEINTDGRATVGRANTIHRADVWTYRNIRGESVGKVVFVGCGSKRYRNTGGTGGATAASSRYDVECAKCLAH